MCEGLRQIWTPRAFLPASRGLPLSPHPASDHAPVGIAFAGNCPAPPRPQSFPKWPLSSPKLAPEFEQLLASAGLGSLRADQALARALALIPVACRNVARSSRPPGFNAMHKISLLHHFLWEVRAPSPDHQKVQAVLRQLPEIQPHTPLDVILDTYDTSAAVSYLRKLLLKHANYDHPPASAAAGEAAVYLAEQSAGGGYRSSLSRPVHAPPNRPNLLKRLKILLPSSRTPITSLAADAASEPSEDPADMARIASRFWGQVWGTAAPRNRRLTRRFLSSYRKRVPQGSQVQASLPLVEEVILSTGDSSPGVDGIPFVAYRSLVHSLSPLILAFIHGLGRETSLLRLSSTNPYCTCSLKRQLG